MGIKDSLGIICEFNKTIEKKKDDLKMIGKV